MKYCQRCLYPDTKPDLVFNEQGICSACIAYEKRVNIDWEQREREFKELCDRMIRYRYQYHCIIPVSGGKDSTYQVIKAKEYGLNPLAVCATTDDLSVLGRANLNNISNIGVDLIEISTNTALRRRINKYTLQEIGDISWAEHVTIFTIPIIMSIKFDIPLIIYGENPQQEYGGPYKAQEATQLTNRWLQEFGGLNGLRVRDIIDLGLATKEDMHLYTYPDLTNHKINCMWLGQFFPWDGLENAITASRHGFKTWYGPVEGVGYNYENLDNHQTGIHDYFKYLKFGFGRCTDLVNNHIKRGRIARSEGKKMVLLYDGKCPATYLGTPIVDTLERIDMTIDEFLEVCNKFANKDLFECRTGKIPRPKFKDILRNA